MEPSQEPVRVSPSGLLYTQRAGLSLPLGLSDRSKMGKINKNYLAKVKMKKDYICEKFCEVKKKKKAV